jgi:hypothetical protein
MVMEHETEPGQAERSAAGSADTQDQPGLVGTGEPGTSGVAAREAGSGEAQAAHDTGEPRVDAALRLLDRLPGLPVSEHPELFEQVHAQLTAVLGELDSPQGLQAN